MNDIVFTPHDHLVVVVAHPDDETFGCGSIVARAARSGARVSIVCATRGEAGEPTPAVDLSSRSLGEIREAELRAAGAILGADHVELLGYADSGFDGDIVAASLCGVSHEALTARVGTVLDALRPTVVVTLDGCDGHRDHVHLRDAVDAATRHRQCRVLHSTIPNSIMRMWLTEKMAAGETNAYQELDPAQFGRPDTDVTTQLDVSDLLDLRLRAIAAHASQHSPFEGLSTPLRDAFLCTDHLVDVSSQRVR
jgi:LmbE family N-acetylglucosaminyl deacetylase